MNYIEEIFREAERKRKVNNEEQLRLQSYLDEEGMPDMTCPSCRCYIGDDMKKWVKGMHGVSYVCRKCYERFDNLRKTLQSKQGLNVGSRRKESQPLFICPSCNKERSPIVDKKLTMRKWLIDPEDGWICISCKIRKYRQINETIGYTSQIVLPYNFLINGWCLRVARMRLQELLMKEEDPKDRLKKISVEILAQEAGMKSKFDWYHLENGSTKTIKRLTWERIKYVFHKHGHEIEDLMENYNVAGDE